MKFDTKFCHNDKCPHHIEVSELVLSGGKIQVGGETITRELVYGGAGIKHAFFCSICINAIKLFIKGDRNGY